MIRRAENRDIPRLLELLSQVLEVHAAGRPDIFISGTTKYGPEELEEILKDDGRPVFVSTDGEDRVLGYAFCEIRRTEGASNLRDSSVDRTVCCQHSGIRILALEYIDAMLNGVVEHLRSYQDIRVLCILECERVATHEVSKGHGSRLEGASDSAASEYAHYRCVGIETVCFMILSQPVLCLPHACIAYELARIRVSSAGYARSDIIVLRISSLEVSAPEIHFALEHFLVLEFCKGPVPVIYCQFGLLVRLKRPCLSRCIIALDLDKLITVKNQVDGTDVLQLCSGGDNKRTVHILCRITKSCLMMTMSTPSTLATSYEHSVAPSR